MEIEHEINVTRYIVANERRYKYYNFSKAIFYTKKANVGFLLF
ncbi:Uncharacterised protein [Yersinia nurmii]|uniref:Uncharacterized protein n=1 Tax=Yersinia nurmii TaxID=685706 RepID=A0ABM9SJH0_9GAMM|nr:Uncharacterised protein [Yersinia nurmii]